MVDPQVPPKVKTHLIFIMTDSEEPQYCEKHRDLTVHCTVRNSSDIGTPYHYGSCMYCIMEGDDWSEEWDSWTEVTSRVVDIILMGLFDWNRGVHFLRDFKPRPKEYSECRAFRVYYTLGQQMGKAGVTNSIGEQYTDPMRLYYSKQSEKKSNIYNV